MPGHTLSLLRVTHSSLKIHHNIWTSSITWVTSTGLLAARVLVYLHCLSCFSFCRKQHTSEQSHQDLSPDGTLRPLPLHRRQVLGWGNQCERCAHSSVLTLLADGTRILCVQYFAIHSNKYYTLDFNILVFSYVLADLRGEL